MLRRALPTGTTAPGTSLKDMARERRSVGVCGVDGEDNVQIERRTAVSVRQEHELGCVRSSGHKDNAQLQRWRVKEHMPCRVDDSERRG